MITNGAAIRQIQSHRLEGHRLATVRALRPPGRMHLRVGQRAVSHANQPSDGYVDKGWQCINFLWEHHLLVLTL